MVVCRFKKYQLNELFVVFEVILSDWIVFLDLVISKYIFVYKNFNGYIKIILVFLQRFYLKIVKYFGIMYEQNCLSL